MSQPYLVDSHCHLNFPQFEGQVPEILARAEQQGVKVMQTICTKLSEFPTIRSLAETYAPLFCSVGIHPHEADKGEANLEKLLEYTAHPKVIGIGETGLDYFYEHSDRESQKNSFHIHIEASRKTQLPLIVHTRDADDDTITILESEYAKGAFPILIHCFTGTQRLADAMLAIGAYISLSGIITFPKALDLQEVAKNLPLDKVLVETDSPYLAPVPYRGKTNEPAFTRHTAEHLAKLQGVGFDEVANITTRNFFNLFKKAVPLVA